jgi:integrase/recombinase XerC
MRVVEKGRKQNVFPLKGYALRCLTDYLEIRAQLLARVGSSHSNREAIFYTVSGKTMNPRSLSRIIDTRAKQAGIKVNIGGRDTIGAHVIRRSGSTRYLQAGAPIESLAQLMNHSDISTTWRYVKGANLDLPKTILDKLGRE